MESNEAMKSLERKAWHETGHTVMALFAGMTVKGVKLHFYGGYTHVETDERTMTLHGRDMILAGRVWEVRRAGVSVGQVVDDMLEESKVKTKRICDYVRLGSPSKSDLIAMIKDELRFVEPIMTDYIYSKVMDEIYDRLYHKWSVTNRQLQKIGKAHGLLVK